MANIGIYGLGVMGRNLALNMEQQGVAVAVYNRTEGDEADILPAFMEREASGKNIDGYSDLSLFIQTLDKPRIILLMIPAGDPVDQVIRQLVPLLNKKDIILDGGNSHFKDTQRRMEALADHHIQYIGMGVSGGEEGARNGPSLMPGGNFKAWPHIKPILNTIAARTPNGAPCCTWIGTGGAGHFVKMVHNGIEYADMQLIGEYYQIMSKSFGLSHDEIADVFESWNQGYLQSFLTEITVDIMRKKDEDGAPLITRVLDVAGHKGTGKWTALAAHELGMPIPVISQAVIQRYLSARYEQRKAMWETFKYDLDAASISPPSVVPDDLERAYTASRIIAHNEGFQLIYEASQHYSWDINLASVAQIWQGGCILQSTLMQYVEKAFAEGCQYLWQFPHFIDKLKETILSLRKVVMNGARTGLSLPSNAAALHSFDAYTAGRLPISLVQAQRDCFGAHSYERIDTPRGRFHHTDWRSPANNAK